MGMEDMFNSFLGDTPSPKKEEPKPKEPEPKEPETVAVPVVRQVVEPTVENKVNSMFTQPAVNVPAKPKIPELVKPEIPDEFTIEEETGPAKTVFTIYGLKGAGKTSTAFSLGGSIACLSFDHKSASIKDQLKNPGIHVYDAVKYLNDSSAEYMLQSAETNFRYINFLLHELEKNPEKYGYDGKPDYIVIDGLEILQQICEMVMRYRNNIGPFQGFPNLNLWKQRRLFMREVHRKALHACQKGVVYTTYTDKDELIQDGTMVTKRDVPKWTDAILYETDVVVKVESGNEKNGLQFYAMIESSKIPTYKTGERKNITSKGLLAFVDNQGA